MKRVTKTFVLIFSIAAFLSAIAYFFGIQSIKPTETAIKKEFNQRQLVLAKGAAQGIEQYLNTLVGKMMVIADSREVQLFNEEESRRLISETFDDITDEGVNDIGILDETGVLKYGVNAPFLEGVDFSFRNYFKEAKKSDSHGKYFIEFIEFKGADIGRKGIALAIPIIADAHGEKNKFLGVILSTVFIDKVADKFVASIKGSERGHALLVDKRQNILWAPDKSVFGKDLIEESKPYPDFQETVKDMIAGNSDVREVLFNKFDDEDKKYIDEEEKIILAYAPVSFPNNEWSVGVWAPEEDAVALIRKSNRNMISVIHAIMLIIFISALVASVSVSRTTSRIIKSEDKFRRISQILQESLIKPVPEIPQLEIWVSYETAIDAELVGGDFYDIYMINENEVAILIGDVAGKGIKAAGLTETIRSTIRALSFGGSSPSNVLEQTNKIIRDQIDDSAYATVLLVFLNILSGQTTIASAGHPPPILLNSSTNISDVSFGLPLGILETKYEEIVINIDIGDGILLYTDGLIESRNKKQFFGEKRVINVLKTDGTKDLKDLVKNIILQATSFANGELSDDVAVIAVRLLSKEVASLSTTIGEKKGIPS